MSNTNYHRDHVEPDRMAYAKKKITDLGFEVTEGEKCFHFLFKGSVVTFYPYTGWASGKTIVDGRGIKELLKQIK